MFQVLLDIRQLPKFFLLLLVPSKITTLNYTYATITTHFTIKLLPTSKFTMSLLPIHLA